MESPYVCPVPGKDAQLLHSKSACLIFLPACLFDGVCVVASLSVSHSLFGSPALSHHYVASVFTGLSVSGIGLLTVCQSVCLSVSLCRHVSARLRLRSVCQDLSKAGVPHPCRIGSRCLHAALPRIWIHKPLQQSLCYGQGMEQKTLTMTTTEAGSCY